MSKNIRVQFDEKEHAFAFRLEGQEVSGGVHVLSDWHVGKPTKDETQSVAEQAFGIGRGQYSLVTGIQP